MNILSFIARYDIYIIIMYTLWATDDLYAIIALQLDLRKFMILKSCKIILFFFSNIIFLSFSYFETTDKHTSVIFLAFQIFFKFFFFFTIRSTLNTHRNLYDPYISCSMNLRDHSEYIISDHLWGWRSSTSNHSDPILFFTIILSST